MTDKGSKSDGGGDSSSEPTTPASRPLNEGYVPFQKGYVPKGPVSATAPAEGPQGGTAVTPTVATQNTSSSTDKKE